MVRAVRYERIVISLFFVSLFFVGCGVSGCGVSVLDLRTPEPDAATPLPSEAGQPALAGDDAGTCGPCPLGEVCGTQANGSPKCVTEWAQGETISLENAQPEAGFGMAVAQFGNTLFVSAPHEIADDAPCGAVYVFEWGGPPSHKTWRRTQRFAAPCDSNGFPPNPALAADNGVLFLGGWGNVHAFQRTGGFWRESAKLDARAPIMGQTLAAADGLLAVVGLDAVRTYAWTNGTFVLRNAMPTTWPAHGVVMTSEVLAFHVESRPHAVDLFIASREGDGFATPKRVATYDASDLSLAADGARIAAGLIDQKGAGAGIDIFEHQGGAYVESVVLDRKACDLGTRYLASNVVLRGDTLFARTTDCGQDRELFHEFRSSASGWQDIAVSLLGADPGGMPVAVTDDGVVLSRLGDMGNSGSIAVWNYDYPSTMLSASEGTDKRRNEFGRRLVASNDVVLIQGNPSVYVYERDERGRFRQTTSFVSWSQTAYNPGLATPPGMSVSGKTLALFEGTRIRLYDRSPDGEWRAGQALTPDPTPEPSAVYEFGRGSVAMEGDILAVGQGFGTVSIYARQGGTWLRESSLTLEQDLSSDVPLRIGGGRILASVGAAGMVVIERGAAGWSIGGRVPTSGKVAAIDGERIAAIPFVNGAPVAAVQIFERRGGEWVKAAELPTQGLAAYAILDAQDLVLNGDSLFVPETASPPWRGGVTTWHRSQTGTWTREGSVTATGLVGTASFGASIARAGSTLLVGAPGADVGSVYHAGWVVTFEHQEGTRPQLR